MGGWEGGRVGGQWVDRYVAILRREVTIVSGPHGSCVSCRGPRRTHL